MIGPPPPSLEKTTPTSPNPSTTPTIVGQAAAGSLIKVYKTVGLLGGTGRAGDRGAARQPRPDGDRRARVRPRATAPPPKPKAWSPPAPRDLLHAGRSPASATAAGRRRQRRPARRWRDDRRRTPPAANPANPAVAARTESSTSSRRSRSPSARPSRPACGGRSSASPTSTGQPGTKFFCRVDRQPWKGCTSPVKVSEAEARASRLLGQGGQRRRHPCCPPRSSARSRWSPDDRPLARGGPGGGLHPGRAAGRGGDGRRRHGRGRDAGDRHPAGPAENQPRKRRTSARPAGCSSASPTNCATGSPSKKVPPAKSPSKPTFATPPAAARRRWRPAARRSNATSPTNARPPRALAKETNPATTTGVASQVFSGLSSSQIFTYVPSAANATYVKATLQFPDPTNAGSPLDHLRAGRASATPPWGTEMSRRDEGQAGFTIVEVLVAILIVSIAAMTTFTLLSAATRNAQRAEASQVALEYAEQELELLRSMEDKNLALTAAPSSSTNANSPNNRVSNGTFALVRGSRSATTATSSSTAAASTAAVTSPEGPSAPARPASPAATSAAGSTATSSGATTKNAPKPTAPGNRTTNRSSSRCASTPRRNQAAERGYVEVQSNFVSPTDNKESDPLPGANGKVITAQQFFLTDTPCSASGSTVTAGTDREPPAPQHARDLRQRPADRHDQRRARRPGARQPAGPRSRRRQQPGQVRLRQRLLPRHLARRRHRGPDPQRRHQRLPLHPDRARPTPSRRSTAG